VLLLIEHVKSESEQGRFASLPTLSALLTAGHITTAPTPAVEAIPLCMTTAVRQLFLDKYARLSRTIHVVPAALPQPAPGHPPASLHNIAQHLDLFSEPFTDHNKLGIVPPTFALSAAAIGVKAKLAPLAEGW
jgi:hypothetical protein